MDKLDESLSSLRGEIITKNQFKSNNLIKTPDLYWR